MYKLLSLYVDLSEIQYFRVRDYGSLDFRVTIYFKNGNNTGSVRVGSKDDFDNFVNAFDHRLN